MYDDCHRIRAAGNGERQWPPVRHGRGNRNDQRFSRRDFTFPIGVITGAANTNPATDKNRPAIKRAATNRDFLFAILFMPSAFIPE